MKISKIIENTIIVLFFLAVIAYPITAYFLGVEDHLYGAEEKVELSFDTLDEYIIQHFPGREFLVRSKNQLLYSLLDVSPNASITKVDDVLMSTESLNYYYHGLHRATDEYMNKTIENLKYLNDILAKKDKKLVVILTPNKPRYYKGRLPFADDVILAYQGNLGRKSYDIFREKLERTDLYQFDCIKYIDRNIKTMDDGEGAPLFYNSGHHWSISKGNVVGLEFMKYLKETVKLKLPDISLRTMKTDKAVYPDSDLFDVLNIYDKPNEQFYKTVIDFDNYQTDELNYIIQGGSFLGALLFPVITIGFHNDVLHIENKNCLYNDYDDKIDFESYDDLNDKIGLLNYIKKTDVFIFEINELNVYNATFGFLDYLLEHEDIL